MLLCFTFEAKYFLTFFLRLKVSTFSLMKHTILKVMRNISIDLILIIALEIVQCFSESQSPHSRGYDTTWRNCVKGVQMNMPRDLTIMKSQSQLN